MAKQNRTILKTYFQQGDIPTQGQYADLIDSQLNLNDGGVQLISGSVSASNFISSADITIAGNVSSSGNLIIGSVTSSEGISTTLLTSTNIKSTNITGSNISASLKIITDKIVTGSAGNGFTLVGDITASNNISASGTITGLTGSFGHIPTIRATNINASGILTTANLNVTTTITASAISSSGLIETPELRLGGTNITATGTEINRLSGVLSNIDRSFDTVSALSQGSIRFTRLDNTTNDISLTNLTGTSLPTFGGLTLTKEIDSSTTFPAGGNVTINSSAFELRRVQIETINANSTSDIYQINNNKVADGSAVYCSTNAVASTVQVFNVGESFGGFKFVFYSPLGQPAADDQSVSCVVL